MKRILLALCASAALLCAPIHAQALQLGPSVDVSGLSAAQVKALNDAVQSVKNANSEQTNLSIAPSDVNDWATVGQNVATAVGAAAKQVGIAVVDFSKTDLGRMVTFVIVFKLVGTSALNLISGLLMGVLGPLLVMRARRSFMEHSAKFEMVEHKFLGLFPYKKRVLIQNHIDQDYAAWNFILTTIAIIAMEAIAYAMIT